MSRQELHDLLAQLKQQRHCVDLIDSEYQQRLDEIVESLEQQKLYPDAFDQYSGLNQQIKGASINQDFFVSARKSRTENHSVYSIHEDLP